MLHNTSWQFVASVLGQWFQPILKGQAVQEEILFGLLDHLPQNVCDCQPVLCNATEKQ